MELTELLASLNLHGGLKKKKPFVEKYLFKNKPAFLFLQETHLYKEEEFALQWEGYKGLYNSLTKKQTKKLGRNRRRGVAILVRNDLIDTTTVVFNSEWEVGRMLAIRLHLNNKIITLMNVYAPTEAKELPNWIDSLKYKMKSLTKKDIKRREHSKKDHMLVIGGDWNIQQAARDTLNNWKPNKAKILNQAIKEPYGLLDPYIYNNKDTPFTWSSTDARSNRIATRIDFFLTNKVESLAPTRHHNSGIPSDHVMISTKLPFTQQTKEHNTAHKNPKLTQETIEKHQKDINDQLTEAIQQGIPGQQALDTICQLLLMNQETTNNTTNKERPNKALSRIKMLLKFKRKLLNPAPSQESLQGQHNRISRFLPLPPIELYANEPTIRKEVLTTIQKQLKGRNKAWNRKRQRQLSRNIQHLVTHRNQQGQARKGQFYRKIKAALYGQNSKGQPSAIQHPTKQQTIITSEKKIKKITHRFWAKKFRRTPAIPFTCKTPTQPIKDFTLRELDQALASKTKDTCPGPNQIPYSMYKVLNDANRQVILQEINNSNQVCPTDWKEALQWNIHKKGSREDLNNYRPIALLNTIYKLKTAMIKNRFLTAITTNKILNPAQIGFLPGKNPSPNILAIRNILYHDKIMKQDTHIAFYDIQGAYDNVPHEALWKCLDKVPELRDYTPIIQDLYEQATTRVITNQGMTEPFEVEKGIRQGDPLSPILFNLFLNQLINQLYSKKKGWAIKEECTPILAFADDIAVITHSKKDMQTLTNTICKFLNKHNMSISTAKSAYLTTQKKKGKIRIKNRYKTEILTASKEDAPTRYLGGYIHPNSPDSMEAQLRIEEIKSKAAIITKKKLPPHLMAEAINALIYSKIIYSFPHTMYNVSTLEELDKYTAHQIRTRSGSFPFPTDKVHQKWKEGGWGLLSLADLYRRMNAAFVVDKVLNGTTCTPTDIIKRVIEELDDKKNRHLGDYTYKTNHLTPPLRNTLKILKKEGLLIIDSMADHLSPEVFFRDTPKLIQEITDAGITDIREITKTLPLSKATFQIKNGGFRIEPFIKTATIYNKAPPLYYKNQRIVWVDGSVDPKTGQATGAVFYNMHHPDNKTVVAWGNTSFEAEAQAILQALLECPEEENILIVTDSLSNIEAISSQDPQEHYTILHIRKIIQKRTSSTTLKHIYSHMNQKFKNDPARWGPKIKAKQIELYPIFGIMKWGNKKVDKLTKNRPTSSAGIPVQCPHYAILQPHTGSWITTTIKIAIKKNHTNKRTANQREREKLRYPNIDTFHQSASQEVFMTNTLAENKHLISLARVSCLPIGDKTKKATPCIDCGQLETHQHVLLRCPMASEIPLQIIREGKAELEKQLLPKNLANEWFSSEQEPHLWTMGFIPKSLIKRNQTIYGPHLGKAIRLMTGITTKHFCQDFERRRKATWRRLTEALAGGS